MASVMTTPLWSTVVPDDVRGMSADDAATEDIGYVAKLMRQEPLTEGEWTRHAQLAQHRYNLANDAYADPRRAVVNAAASTINVCRLGSLDDRPRTQYDTETKTYRVR